MSSIKTNYLYNAAYQILKIALPLITVPYLARVLGADAIGSYSFMHATTNYFVLFGLLGLNQYGNREIARVRDDHDKKSQTFWSIFCMQLFFAGISFIFYIGWCFSSFNTSGTLSLIWMLWVAADFFDINWFFFGTEEFKLTVTRNIILKLLALLLILVFVKSPNDLGVYCFIIAGNSLLSCLVLWPFLLKRVRFYKPSASEIVQHIKPNLVLFVPVLAISLYTQLDKILLGSLSTMTQLGYYEYSERISKIPLALITAMGTVMLPRMSNVFAKGNINLAKEYLNKSFSFSIAMSMCFCFGIIAVANNFVELFFGSGWDDCIVLMILLSAIIPLIAVSNVVGVQYLIPSGQERVYTISVIAGAALNVVLNLILIPSLNATGTVIATIATEAIVLTVQLFFAREVIDFKYWVRDTVSFLLIGTVMLFSIHLVDISIGSSFVILLLKIGIGGLIFLGCSAVYLKATNHPLLSVFSLSKRHKKITH